MDIPDIIKMRTADHYKGFIHLRSGHLNKQENQL